MRKLLRESKWKVLLAGALMIALGLSLTACSSDEEEDAFIDDDGVVVRMSLPSDTANELEWTLDQSQELFDADEMFMTDEGAEEGGETQEFYLFPQSAGQTTLSFTTIDAEGNEVVYLYECTVADDLSTVTIDKSSGTKGDETVEPPELFVDIFG